MSTLHPPTGHAIVTELLTEMEERLYPLVYRTLPPSVFHVYLHPDDFKVIDGITAIIVAEAQQGLTSRVEALNKRSRLSSLISGRRPPIEVPSGGWQIAIHADANGEIEPGQLGIESRLSVPPPPRYEGGTPTARIARTVVTGSIRRSAAPEETADGGTTGPSQPARLAPMGTARLAYVDDEGPHVFVMRKDLISIGRGGSAHWVDVQVVSTARVSREHCRIRKSSEGRYFLQDVSSWGTSVDGKPVAPFARQSEGRVEQTGSEHELPPRARIQLADAVTIEFTVEP
jgi:pSer/pThr/pTyr-binding forkhead associated (FHA) protein